MQRKYIILSAVVLAVIALGFFVFNKKDILSKLPDIRFEGEGDDNSNIEGEGAPVEGKYSVSAPSDFKVTTTNGDGYLITTYEKGAKEGFQVFVMPYDEPGPITPERILLDVDVEILNPQYISVDGIEALAFNSKDEGFGNTYDVWLVRDNKLYQITTYSTYKTQLLNILSSWKFQ